MAVIIFQMVAFDKDSGDNGQVEYSIMEAAKSAGRFRIHPSTGVVYAQKSLVAGQEFAFSVSCRTSIAYQLVKGIAD